MTGNVLSIRLWAAFVAWSVALCGVASARTDPHVFFAHGKAVVPAYAKTWIKNFVVGELTISKECLRTARIWGHMDTLEAEEPNSELDLRRAEATRDLMVELGWPADRIGPLERKGTTLPLHQPQPGTAEPQNRRSDIWFYSAAEGERVCTFPYQHCVLRLKSGLICSL